MQISEKLIQDLEDFSINGIPYPMIYVEGGSFDRGSMESKREQPIREVTVPSFFMAKYLMTQDLYKEIMKGENPAKFKGDRRPVEKVSWNHIQNAFLPAWDKHPEVQELLKSADAKMKFRLPSEAEWEFAAKGGNHSESYYYAGSDDLAQVGWYNKNSGMETKPVGLLNPNELSIQDMSGNVFEWCADDYYEDYTKTPDDGKAWIDTPKRARIRVVRGGSCFRYPFLCRPSYRLFIPPDFTNINIGFRLVFGFLVQ